MACTTVFGFTYFFLVLFQCWPVSAWWNYGIGSQYCMNPHIILDMTYTASVLNAIADWTFGTLPIFIVWNLNIPMRQKTVVACILAFAAVGSVATIVRIPMLASILNRADFLCK